VNLNGFQWSMGSMSCGITPCSCLRGSFCLAACTDFKILDLDDLHAGIKTPMEGEVLEEIYGKGEAEEGNTSNSDVDEVTLK